MGVLVLLSPVKEVIERTLPKDVIASMKQPTSSNTITVSTYEQFVEWCCKKCDVDILLDHILLPNDIPIVHKARISIRMLMGSRLSPTSRERMTQLRNVLVSERDLIKKNTKKAHKSISSTHCSVNVFKARRSTLYSTCHYNDTFTLPIDVIKHVMSFCIMNVAFACRRVSKMFYDAYRDYDIQLDVFPYIKHTMCNVRVVLISITDSRSTKYSSAGLVHDIHQLDARKQSDPQYLLPDYYNDMYNAASHFIDSFCNKCIVQWPIPYGKESDSMYRKPTLEGHSCILQYFMSMKYSLSKEFRNQHISLIKKRIAECETPPPSIMEKKIIRSDVYDLYVVGCQLLDMDKSKTMIVFITPPVIDAMFRHSADINRKVHSIRTIIVVDSDFTYDVACHNPDGRYPVSIHQCMINYFPNYSKIIFSDTLSDKTSEESVNIKCCGHKFECLRSLKVT